MSSSISEQSEPAKIRPHKLFVTGLDGKSDLKDLQQELRKLFGSYGDLQSVVAKRSFNGAYCFAFVDFKEGEDALKAVEEENNSSVNGKRMSVELQDNSRRRKGTGEGCYECGKIGHFARECRNKGGKNGKDRSRSDSYERRKKKKHKRRHDSYSYSSDRSRKKQKRKRSKSRKKKHSKGKKHKKERRRSYSSDSD